MAWARDRRSTMEKAEADEGLTSVIDDGAPVRACRPRRERSREVAMAWARSGTTTTEEVTTTTRTRRAQRWGSMWVSNGNDNYGGGDDNYPRVVEMGAVGREEGRGWDRQK
jgi:hypothetical protein